MIKRELPVKPVMALEDFNKYAAIADVDGMSWSDRCGFTFQRISALMLSLNSPRVKSGPKPSHSHFRHKIL